MKITKRRFLQSTGLAMASIGVGVTPSSAKSAEVRSYIVSTASTGGTFYPVGVAIATLAKLKLGTSMGLSFSAINSAGSGENIKLMRENQVQFSILQGLYGAWAWRGEGDFAQTGKQDSLRAVAMLWQNVEQFVLRSRFAYTGTIDDLQGFGARKFSIGPRNSGTEGSCRTILTNLGIDPETLSLAHMGYSASADAMLNGTIHGMTIPSGVPTSAVTRAYAVMGNDITMLEFTNEQMSRANGGSNLWSRYEIPVNTYPGQDRIIKTIAQPNFLAVNADVPEEDVYQLTKTIFENLSFLNGIHAATRDMSIDAAVVGVPVPLHPGSARYYREVGIEIPSHLIAR